VSDDSESVDNLCKDIDYLEEKLKKVIVVLRKFAKLKTSEEQDYAMGMAGAPDCDILAARKIIKEIKEAR